MNKKTDAKCNGSMLSVGFHSANPPLIWRFDLERNHSFTIALQGEDGDWELGITTPKGDFYSIVHFVAREDAEEAFLKVEKILAQRNSAVRTTIKAVIMVLCLALLTALAVALFGLYVTHKELSTPTRAIPGPQSQSAPGNLEQGIPLSADDVLKPPSP